MDHAVSETKALAGKSIFISASCPPTVDSDEFPIPDPYEVDGAITAVTRAVLRAGGRLVFGGHPTIAPLIQAASEHYFPSSTDSDDPDPDKTSWQMRQAMIENGTHPVVMFLSDAFRAHIQDVMQWLIDDRWADVRWVPAELSEKAEFDDVTGLKADSVKQSLLTMRRTMLGEEDLVAAVFIGGKKRGLKEELELFQSLHPAGIIYAFAAPGGYARSIAQQVAHPGYSSEAAAALLRLHDPQDGDDYPALAAWMAHDIAIRAAQ